MKKRLCLLIISLLLFISAGCSQTDYQAPGTSAAGTPGSVAGSAATVDPGDADASLNDYSGSINTGTLPGSTDAGSHSSSADIEISSNAEENDSAELSEDGAYTSKEDVALYIHLYGHLPPNFITKKEAEKLGWKGGSLEPFAPGMCIGGSHFGNYEGLLPEKEGRSYTECDIDTLGADKRGAKRIVYSNDGLIYYTEDHYASFELLYGDTDAGP